MVDTRTIHVSKDQKSILSTLTHTLFLLFHNISYTDSSHNYRECMAISRKLSDESQLPKECLGYKDIVSSLRSSSSKTDASIAFQGMGSSAAAAAAARGRGQENYAQIQRRYTHSRRFSKERN